MEKKESTQIGGAWKKTSAAGRAYISGKLNNGKYFAIFPNGKKVEGSNQPDYRIVMNLDDATELGLLDEYTARKQEEAVQAREDRQSRLSDDVDLSGIDFGGENGGE